MRKVRSSDILNGIATINLLTKLANELIVF